MKVFLTSEVLHLYFLKVFNFKLPNIQIIWYVTTVSQTTQERLDNLLQKFKSLKNDKTKRSLYTLVTIQTLIMSKGDSNKLDSVGLTNFQTQLLFVTNWLVCLEEKKADADLRRSSEQRQRET